MKRKIEKYYELINHCGQVYMDSYNKQLLEDYRQKHYKGKMTKIIEVSYEA